MCSLQDENGFLQTTNEELIRMQGEKKTVVRTIVEKLVKSITTRFVGMEMFVNMIIKSDVCERRLSCTILTEKYVKIGQDVSSKVSREVLTLMKASAWPHWIRFSWCSLVIKNSHLLREYGAGRSSEYMR